MGAGYERAAPREGDCRQHLTPGRVATTQRLAPLGVNYCPGDLPLCLPTSVGTYPRGLLLLVPSHRRGTPPGWFWTTGSCGNAVMAKKKSSGHHVTATRKKGTSVWPKCGDFGRNSSGRRTLGVRSVFGLWFWFLVFGFWFFFSFFSKKKIQKAKHPKPPKTDLTPTVR